jgi:hypothetical protein
MKDNEVYVINVLKPGYAFVTAQPENPKEILSAKDGFESGTIFKELNLPLGVYEKTSAAKVIEMEV